jgi:FAD:protein FMN transferase
MSRKSTRRDFLRGRAAADATARRADEPDDRAPPDAWTPAVAGGYTMRIGRRAMACRFEICLNAGQYDEGAEAALAALDRVAALERQLSYFRDESELARVNREAYERPVAVEQDLFELIELGQRVYTETGGAFDLSATPLWEAWGFAQRAGRIPSEAEIAEALERVGSGLVELDPERRTVRFARPGVRLNLGSIGKGHALDRCAETLLAAGVEDFVIHGGFSSILARGSQALPVGIEGRGARGEGRGEGDEGRGEAHAHASVGMAPGMAPGWTVGLRHPIRPQRRVGEVVLRDRALGTSGSWAQSFRHEGRRYGHVIDPRTGRPADRLLSATVLAPSAALADALATAFYVMGAEAAAEFCRARPDLAAVLACPACRGGGMELRTVGLAEGEWTELG